MNNTQKGIITLMRSALTGEKLALPEGFDFAAAYEGVKGHHMVTMMYEGALNCGISPQSPAVMKLFPSVCKAIQVSEGQLSELQRIFGAFESEGIDYMPLKGCIMKHLYPRPELRMMGDADILIRCEQYDRIVPVMKELGFEEGNVSDHELVWTTPLLYTELHSQLMPDHHVDSQNYFRDGWDFAKVRDGSRFSMTDDDTFIYLFAHFAKHFRARGIGCRHMADLWVYLRSHPELNEEYILSELDNLHLSEFHRNIRHCLMVWFEDAPENEQSRIITDYIFSSGSWGSDESMAVSVVVRDSGASGNKTRGRIAYILHLMFPGVDVLRDKYTVLKKAPVLLPLVWLYRPFYKLFSEPRSMRRRVNTISGLTDERLDRHRRIMEGLGLDASVW